MEHMILSELWDVYHSSTIVNYRPPTSEKHSSWNFRKYFKHDTTATMVINGASVVTAHLIFA
jgi:hypothetical protein